MYNVEEVPAQARKAERCVRQRWKGNSGERFNFKNKVFVFVFVDVVGTRCNGADTQQWLMQANVFHFLVRCARGYVRNRGGEFLKNEYDFPSCFYSAKSGDETHRR